METNKAVKVPILVNFAKWNIWELQNQTDKSKNSIKIAPPKMNEKNTSALSGGWNVHRWDQRYESA